MTTISQADPIAETVRNMMSPDRDGASYVMKRHIVMDLEGGNANGFAFAVQNPEDVDCVVTNVVLNIETAGGTALSVLDVDVASDAAATGNNIIDGLDLNTTGVFDRHSSAGTNGGSPRKWDRRGGGNDYVTGKILSRNAAALSGKAIIEYVPLA